MNALAPVRTIGPTAELISLADAKAQCRVTHSSEDGLIAELVAAATGWLDGYSGQLGQALIEQTWSQSFSCFPADRCLRLALGPLRGTPAVTYYDSAGQAQSFTGFVAVSDVLGPKLVLGAQSSWPSVEDRPDAVTVTWQCGFGTTAASVPVPIIRAAKLLISHWYQNREAAITGTIVTELPLAVQALIRPLRKVGM